MSKCKVCGGNPMFCDHPGWEAPDPRRAKETVKEMSDAQVVDLLTQLGSKTASWRAPAENRAFLTELLGAMPHQTIPTEEE